jgi:hypothetical protein
MIMNEDKIITIRFKLGNTQDMELYREIECEKNCLGMSMPAYIKGVLQEHFAKKPSGNMEEELLWMLKDEMDQYQKNIQGMIREELMSLSSVLLATLVRMSGTGTDVSETITNPDITIQKSTEDSKDNLPEYSDELPDGFDDVLGKLM